MEKYRRESFLLTSAHEIVPRSYDIDELCIEFIRRKKQLIDHTPLVEIRAVESESLKVGKSLKVG